MQFQQKTSYSGFCPICNKEVVFNIEGQYLRDNLRCSECKSIPRHRALIHVLEKNFPNFRNLQIHESSPGGAASLKLKKECKNYTETQYFLDVKSGAFKNNIRCEDLENQTFPDNTFDIIITQDVFEHILEPEKAFKEIKRTLKPGGYHIFTLPWYYWKKTLTRATGNNGFIEYLEDPIYHKNPVNPEGSLVVNEWGNDLIDFIYKSCGMTTCPITIIDESMGIYADFIDVFISFSNMPQAKL